MRNTRILFLTDNFPPEVNAPATRTYEHAREWVERGLDVTVITGVPNFPRGKIYSGYRNRLYRTEIIDNIRVIRVWTYITPNEGFFRRTADYISFSISALICGLFLETDLIVATSPQFFTALAGRALAFWKRKPWIMEVRDLWPESVKAVNAMKNSFLLRYLEWEEIRCYRSARKIIVVTDAFKRKLMERKIEASRIEVVKNGVNRTFFSPVPKDMELIGELKLEGKRIIGYIGTHGMAHRLDFILSCAGNMQSSNNCHFLFIGDGAEKANLARLKERLKLTNLTMLPSIPRKDIKRYISILDIALIHLRKSELFETVIPSKIFENAGMQKPILIGVNGEARNIVESYSAGIYFEPENEADFREKLEMLLSDVDLYNKCREGCSLLADDFDRKKMAAEMYDILLSAASARVG